MDGRSAVERRRRRARRGLRLFLCGLVVASLVAAALPGAAAHPPPEPLCDACGEGFEERAESPRFAVGDERRPPALGVERSTATVIVHENGTATWVVRNRLDDSETADRLLSNATYRKRVADGALRDADLLGTDAEGSALTMRYRRDEFAERSVGGAYRTGEFTREYGYRNLDGLGADRLDVVAPPDTRVARTVPGATVSDDGRQMTLTDLDEGRIVTFVPRDAALAPLWSALAVGGAVAPAVAINALVSVATPAALFGLLAVAGHGALSRGERLARRAGLSAVLARSMPGACLAAIGTALAVGTLALGIAGIVGGSMLPVLGAGVGYAVLGALLTRPRVRRRTSYRTLVVAAAAGIAVATAVTTAIAAVDGVATAAGGIAFHAPLFALLPAGYALGSGDRRLAVGTAIAALALGVLPVAPLTAPGGGLLFALLAAGTALSATLLGAPLLAAGAALATGEPPAGRDGA